MVLFCTDTFLITNVSMIVFVFLVFVFLKHWMLFMDMVGIMLPCYIQRDKNENPYLVHCLSKMVINVFANNLVMQAGRKHFLPLHK